MTNLKEGDRYLSGHFIGDLIDPRNEENKEVQIKYIYKSNIWTNILSAAAGSIVSTLLFKLLTEEKSHGSGFIEME